MQEIVKQIQHYHEKFKKNIYTCTEDLHVYKELSSLFVGYNGVQRFFDA